jgi:cytochrome P450
MEDHNNMTVVARLHAQSATWQSINNPSIAIALTLLALAVTTRFLSGLLGASKPAHHGSKSVPMLPYWLPVLGHIPQFTMAPQRLLSKARDTYTSGIFALNLGTTTHNIVFSPPMGGLLMNQKHSIADMDSVGKYILMAVFGYPTSKASMAKYDQATPALQACYKHVLSEPSLSEMVQRTIDTTKRNIANLVTFSESKVDQLEWERTSHAETITMPSGHLVVEVSLKPLIRDFIACNANPALIGSDFVNNNPNFFQHLWDLDSGFKWLATGLPAWLPIPQLWRAKLARNRAFATVREWEVAMQRAVDGKDAGHEWQDLHNVGPVLTQRLDVYRQFDFTMDERAALDLCLLWAMNANTNMLVFWMLNHIYADKSLLARLREEIAPYVHAVQPKQRFGLPESPCIDKLDYEALDKKCHLLKSCYIESLRLDAAPWSFRVMQEDLLLAASREPDSDKFFLKKGTYAHIAHSIHHTDPAYFDDPQVWRADRHIKHEHGDTEPSVSMGTIRPYGQSSCILQRHLLTFVYYRRRTKHVQGPELCAKGSIDLCGIFHHHVGHGCSRRRCLEVSTTQACHWSLYYQ